MLQVLGMRDAGIHTCDLTFRARSPSLSAVDSIPATVDRYCGTPADHAAHAEKQSRRLPDLDARARVRGAQPAPLSTGYLLFCMNLFRSLV